MKALLRGSLSGLAILFFTSAALAADPETLRSACDAGRPDNCFLLGKKYIAGDGVAQDYSRGVAYLQKACEGAARPEARESVRLGARAACMQLARLFFEGAGPVPSQACFVPISPLLGLRVLEQGCAAGDPEACEWLARVRKKLPPKPPAKPKGPIWKAQIRGGFLYANGNATSIAGSGSGLLSRQAANNKFSFEAGIAYGKSKVDFPFDLNKDKLIEKNELIRTVKVTADAWFTQLRYDRIFLERNSIYVFGGAGADLPAGKKLIGGVSLGYSRTLIKSGGHLTKLELGYDFSHEDYVAKASPSIHSLRGFLGHAYTVSQTLKLFGQVEANFNLTSENAPTPDGQKAVPVGADIRVGSRLGFVTKLWKFVDFGVTYTLKYDETPAPKGAYKIPFAPDFTPYAKQLDMQIDAAVIINLL